MFLLTSLREYNLTQKVGEPTRDSVVSDYSEFKGSDSFNDVFLYEALSSGDRTKVSTFFQVGSACRL